MAAAGDVDRIVLSGAACGVTGYSVCTRLCWPWRRHRAAIVAEPATTSTNAAAVASIGISRQVAAIPRITVSPRNIASTHSERLRAPTLQCVEAQEEIARWARIGLHGPRPQVIADWRRDHNEVRPHSSCGRIPPAQFAATHRALFNPGLYQQSLVRPVGAPSLRQHGGKSLPCARLGVAIRLDFGVHRTGETLASP